MLAVVGRPIKMKDEFSKAFNRLVAVQECDARMLNRIPNAGYIISQKLITLFNFYNLPLRSIFMDDFVARTKSLLPTRLTKSSACAGTPAGYNLNTVSKCQR